MLQVYETVEEGEGDAERYEESEYPFVAHAPRLEIPGVACFLYDQPDDDNRADQAGPEDETTEEYSETDEQNGIAEDKSVQSVFRQRPRRVYNVTSKEAGAWERLEGRRVKDPGTSLLALLSFPFLVALDGQRGMLVGAQRL